MHKDSSEGKYQNLDAAKLPNEAIEEEKTISEENTTYQANGKLIKDTVINLETKAFDEFVANVKEQAALYGGYVQSSDKAGNSYYSNENRFATFVLRIPSEKLEEFTNFVSEQANVTSSTESVRDVTLDYVDTESRVTALKTEQQRLLELMDSAESLTDILAIESRLTEVRYELESYEARLRNYDNLISYSTVTLQIEEVERVISTRSQGIWQEIYNKLSNNLYNLGKGLRSLFVGVVSSSPYIILCLIIAYLISRLIKKIKKHKAS